MKKFLLQAFFIGSALAALVYLLACLTPYISPHLFWPMAFLALGFPYIFLFVGVLIVIWLFIQRKIAVLLLFLLLFGYKNIFSTIGLHPFPKPVENRKSSLRIMTWNVRGFDNPSNFSDTPGSLRLRMFDFINESAPDIICMQEFAEHKAKSLVSNTTELLDMGYNYFYRTDEFSHRPFWGSIKSGTAIFSKIPVTGYGKQMYPDSSYPENIMFIDVKLDNKPLRIFSTHLKSLNLDAVLLDSNNRAKYYGDSNFVYEASKFEKLKIFPQDHAKESRIAKGFMNQSPFPIIFCGDLNSVPTSYPYHVISYGLQDAFLQKGFGLGTTMDSLPKTLRIDYLLVDKKVQINNYQKMDVHLSDHFPQIIDVQWKN